MDVWFREEGPFESLQTVLYLAAGGVLAWHARRRGVGWGAYAAVFFFVAGEETSWAQRMLHLPTPAAVAAVKVQGETTLHDLVWFHQLNHGLGFLGAFALSLCVPWAPRYIPPLTDVYARQQLPCFPAWLLPLPLTGLLLTLLPRQLIHRVFSDLDELGELYVAAGSFAFAMVSVAKVMGAEEGATAQGSGRATEGLRAEGGGVVALDVVDAEGELAARVA